VEFKTNRETNGYWQHSGKQKDRVVGWTWGEKYSKAHKRGIKVWKLHSFIIFPPRKSKIKKTSHEYTGIVDYNRKVKLSRLAYAIPIKTGEINFPDVPSNISMTTKLLQFKAWKQQLQPHRRIRRRRRGCFELRRPRWAR